jgi:hypothetical protein
MGKSFELYNSSLEFTSRKFPYRIFIIICRIAASTLSDRFIVTTDSSRLGSPFIVTPHSYHFRIKSHVLELEFRLSLSIRQVDVVI